MCSVPSRRLDRHLRRRGLRVLDHVGEALCDDEVGARLDLGREALGGEVVPAPGGRAAPDRRARRRGCRRGRARREASRARARAARRCPAPRARAPRRSATPPRRRRRCRARCASFSVTIVCTSRCCAPSCRSRTTRRRASSASVSRRARDAVSWSRLSALAIAVSSSWVNCARRCSVSGGGRRVVHPVGDRDAPEPAVDDDRRPDAGGEPESWISSPSCPPASA